MSVWFGMGVVPTRVSMWKDHSAAVVLRDIGYKPMVLRVKYTSLFNAEVNECEEGTAHCSQVCINTRGGYGCGCNKGFHLARDGFSCLGTDHCRGVNCSNGGTCINEDQAYFCSCIPGFTGKHCDEESWYKNPQTSNFIYTSGITFIESGALLLPISVSGMKVDSTNQRIYTTNVKTTAEVLPKWLDVGVLENITHLSQHFDSSVLTGREINHGPCRGAPLEDNENYVVLQIFDGFSFEFYGQKVTLPIAVNIQPYCFIIKVCEKFGNTVYFMFPERFKQIFNEIKLLKPLVRRYGFKFNPRGVGISINKQIKGDVSTTGIAFWTGQSYNQERTLTKANIWMNGKISFKVGGLRFEETETTMFLSTPSIASMVRSMTLGEWQISLKTKVPHTIRISFGSSFELPITALNGDITAFASVGGINARTQCGRNANPSGLYVKATVNYNPFGNIPIFKYFHIFHAVADIKILIETQFQQNLDSPSNSLLIPEYFELQSLLEDFLNLTKMFKQRLQEDSTSDLKLLDDAKLLAENFITKLKDDVAIVKARQNNDLETVLNDLSDTWKIYFKNFENITHVLTNHFDNGSLNAFADLFQENIRNIKDKSQSMVATFMQQFDSLFQKTYGIGIKFIGNINLFGLNIAEIDIEILYKTTKDTQCKSIAQKSSILKSNNAVIALGYLKTKITLSKFIQMREAGFGVIMSLDDWHKIELIFNGQVTILSVDATADILVSGKGIYFHIEAPIFYTFKAQLDVSAEMAKNQRPNWNELHLNIAGKFVADADGDGSFQDSYLSGLINFTKHIADEANARITKAQDYFTNLQRKMTDAQHWLEDKKGKVLSAKSKFDDAIHALEIAKDKLERAKGPFRRAIDKLNAAKDKVDHLCTIKTCSKICVPGLKCSICHKKIWFVNVPYPCCHFTSFMFSVSNPICVAANLGCRTLRGVAIAALEVAKLGVRIPIAALDVAKAAVSVAQFVVDKAKTVLDIAAGAFSLAQYGLEGAKLLAEGAKLALEVVKKLVELGAKAFSFIIQYGLQSILDVRNCGFEIQMSTADLPVFDVQCEINAFKSGFRKFNIRINFKHPFESIWNSAKSIITTLLKAVVGITGRSGNQQIQARASYLIYSALRDVPNNNRDSNIFEICRNKTIETVFDTLGFKEKRNANDYESRKEIFRGKCAQFTKVHNFLYDSITVLLDMVEDSAQTLANITRMKEHFGELHSNMSRMVNNASLQDLTINQTVAEEQFNISSSEVKSIIKDSNAVRDATVLFTNTTEYNKHIESEMESANNFQVVSRWLLVMNDLASKYFSSKTCVTFSDCTHYSITLLYELFIESNVANKSSSLKCISNFEERFLELVGNKTQNIQDVHEHTQYLVNLLDDMHESDAFCSKPPERLTKLRSQKVFVGGNIHMACNATGSPKPHFEWFKNGRPLKQHKDMVLIIPNASPIDAGMYHCIAGNLVANLTFEEARVEVTGKKNINERFNSFPFGYPFRIIFFHVKHIDVMQI
ncbi:FBLN5-like protein [Mya arenaria]|uniref:FBLN5-like protein n=1 Tax=Mya arenaria TaxID=6604 RepID=A0ABY7FG61_MYAAR|nr:FBLN5-like protein [Mya arenaria]